jgi:hypothetical protein
MVVSSYVGEKEVMGRWMAKIEILVKLVNVNGSTCERLVAAALLIEGFARSELLSFMEDLKYRGRKPLVLVCTTNAWSRDVLSSPASLWATKSLSC